MKVLTVVGTRPQFIKAAVVSRAIAKYNEDLKTGINPVKEIIVHTGQHYDTNMSEVFFKEMHIPNPNYNLGIGSGTHGTMTGRMLEGIERIIMKEKPDMVLVYGDTNSTFAGAMAAVKLHVAVAHVEAGLRSYNMKMPEEINRILTDRISRLLFCPTQNAINNLLMEGFNQDKGGGYQIYNVGDVMYDAALYYKNKISPIDYIKALIKKFNSFYLATVHRAENTDNPDRLKSILAALDTISATIPVVLPLHPRTRKIICSYNIEHKSIYMIQPVGYFDMLSLLSACSGVFTDSGGVQKEAYFFEQPCITLRDETEWVELVDNGFNVLAGADYEKILEAEERVKIKNLDFSVKLYGDGNAGTKTVDILTNIFN